MSIRILCGHREHFDVGWRVLLWHEPQLDTSLLSRPVAAAQVLFEILDLFFCNEVGERPAYQLVWIVPKQLASNDVDLLNEPIFIETCVAYRRKIVEIGIPDPRMRKLLLCFA